jgi:hypothetical protein
MLGCGVVAWRRWGGGAFCGGVVWNGSGQKVFLVEFSEGSRVISDEGRSHSKTGWVVVLHSKKGGTY